MEDNRLDRVKEIHEELKQIAGAWARKEAIDEEKTAALRREAILLNHRRYIDMIPAYSQLAEEVETLDNPDIDFIKNELMSTDDLFKSYAPEWLDAFDFQKMNKWMETIFAGDVNVPVDGLETVDQWMGRLTEHGINCAFSSGTSGRVSFVPRDQYNWDNFLNNSLSYLIFFLMELGLSLTDEFDAASLSFKGGNMGIGLVGQRISNYAKDSYFLYEMEISIDALRVMRRGPTNEKEEELARNFKERLSDGLEANYNRMISRIMESVDLDRKVFIFGAPFQMKELCELIISGGNNMKLAEKSAVLFGGGWKTFEGEKIERSELTAMIQDAFDVSDQYTIEGFSMTEMNMALLRCSHGRYHIPPLSEPVIFDEALLPLEGDDLTGGFGFLDPFATSYPGFLITGDNVHIVKEKCDCGLTGPAIVGEVARAAGREVKGCGGIMSEMKA